MARAQKPAEGLMQLPSFGKSKWYLASCVCGDHDHAHTIEVEAEETGEVVVTIYTDQTTDFWSQKVDVKYNIKNDLLQRVHWFVTGLWNGFWRRITVTKELWLTGTIKYHSTVIMTEQQTINYMSMLKTATDEVKAYKAKTK